jgi:hypothetical protein
MPSNSSKYTEEMREQTAKLIIETRKSATSFAEETGTADGGAAEGFAVAGVAAGLVSAAGLVQPTTAIAATSASARQTAPSSFYTVLSS